jgi:hypothetical protein
MSISQLRIDDDMLAASGGALPEDHSEQHACVQWLWRAEGFLVACLLEPGG